jgi:hypothetical protein
MPGTEQQQVKHPVEQFAQKRRTVEYITELTLYGVILHKAKRLNFVLVFF